MNYRIDCIDDVCIEAELPEALAGIPEWRRRQALAFRHDLDRYLCARAFLCLQELVERECGVAQLPEFAYTPMGKPYLAEYPAVHFSISHCRKAIACAVNDAPVGIDVEPFALHREVVEAVFSQEESQSIASAAAPEERFAELWTQKESILKLTGEGICDDMKPIQAKYASMVRLDTTLYHRQRLALSIATWR